MMNPNKIADNLQKVGKVIIAISIICLVIIGIFKLTTKEDMTYYTTCTHCGKTEMVYDKHGQIVKSHIDFDAQIRPICDDCAEGEHYMVSPDGWSYGL